MKKIIISVTNDVVTDQRVFRVAGTLSREGYEIQIVGRWLKNGRLNPASAFPAAYGGPGERKKNKPKRIDDSSPVAARSFNPNDLFKVHRFRMLFHTGPLFYAFFNVRLFFFLLLKRADIFISNDLDTLLASYLASKMKKIPLLYDSHEYFTEVPELIGRKQIRKFWLKIEKTILPHLKYSYTVNSSLANVYEKQYSISMRVIRNCPELNDSKIATVDIPVPEGRRIIIYQGVLNVGRGLDHLIESMQFVSNALCLIVGDGPDYSRLSGLIRTFRVEEKVMLMGKVLPEELKGITMLADLGVSIEENLGLNYYYALPNKIFDYIHAKVPVLVSPFPEMKSLLEQFEVGETLVSREPYKIGQQINSILGNSKKNLIWRRNLEIARKELCWQNEEGKLIEILSKAKEDQGAGNS